MLSLLALLSGACGLAYEIILSRLFSNYFGDNFLMSGIVLCGVFFGIACGALLSWKFLRALAWIEIAIGLYAVLVITLFSNWGFDIVAYAGSPLINALKLTLFLIIPAFLIGTCVPLFTHYAQANSGEYRNVFSHVYGLYNVGALLSVCAIEFWLFRSFGLQITGYSIAVLNFMIGVNLLWLKPWKRLSESSTREVAWPERKIGCVLFSASLASGVFQLFVLRFSFSIFGPLQENFAIILISAIAGLAIGSWMALRNLLSFQQAVIGAAIAILMLFVLASGVIDFWILMLNWAQSDFQELILKILLLVGLSLPVFLCFGALVPLAVQQNESRQAVAGTLLAISSFGNGVGVLLMYCLLYPHLNLPTIALILVAMLMAAWAFIGGRVGSWASGLAIAATSAVLVFSGLKLWPQAELTLGYRTMSSADQIEYSRRSFITAKQYKHYDQSAALVSLSDGSRSLVFNGYRSLTFGPNSRADLHEAVVGMLPAVFTQSTSNALVLGLGTGISAGSTALIYDHTDVVEINPAILEIPHHFPTANHNIMQRDSVDVILDDGISRLLRDEQSYDAIINTVTSPNYYAASKLYTQDFYDIVKTRLNDRGMYSTWFDLTISEDGIAILLNTLDESFSHCRYFVLNAAYFNALCSEQPIIYRSTSEVQNRLRADPLKALFKRHGLVPNFGTFFAALEVRFDASFMTRSSAAINTLDLPAIEFVVSRASDQERASDRLGHLIASNVDAQRRAALGKVQWRENCRLIMKMTRLEFEGC
ncbi:hypothetical protein [Roseovarius sp. EL26]|uniref:spermine/spermidine synthase domain-containing protein n=1 Tax=Roseovarius sp. EL26 TaxID=2126672 RepID=UPI000EA28147|nr:hypothetical protein [Roseovarius sp. EL26]